MPHRSPSPAKPVPPRDEWAKALNARLRRVCFGVRAKELAFAFDLEPAAARRYLHGEVPPPVFLAKLSKLGISADWLLNGIGPMRRVGRRRAVRR